ncbi:loricrin-like [Pistacia vera]|uniref:loricrin-like n=1 Tax=Pistacia vera TaxID=55513 RepID=UPI001262C756|nr:loricrin-like [Pistacia vera]
MVGEEGGGGDDGGGGLVGWQGWGGGDGSSGGGHSGRGVGWWCGGSRGGRGDGGGVMVAIASSSWQGNGGGDCGLDSDSHSLAARSDDGATADACGSPCHVSSSLDSQTIATPTASASCHADWFVWMPTVRERFVVGFWVTHGCGGVVIVGGGGYGDIFVQWTSFSFKESNSLLVGEARHSENGALKETPFIKN